MLKRGLIIGAIVLIAGIIAALFIHDANTPPTPVALPLTKTFDQSPTGFTIQYPGEWEYAIPSVGLMILGPSETLFDNVPGPTFTIQRAEPLSVVGSLDNALDRYLQNGPLRISGQWQITQAANVFQFQDRDARVVELQASSGGQAALAQPHPGHAVKRHLRLFLHDHRSAGQTSRLRSHFFSHARQPALIGIVRPACR